MKNILPYTAALTLLSTTFTGCFEENDNTGPPDPKYFSKQVSEIISPLQNRTVKIYEKGGSNDSLTEIQIGFGRPKEYGGGGIFAARGIALGIKVKWEDEDNLQITYRSDLQLYPKIDTVCQLFDERVKIHYIVIKK